MAAKLGLEVGHVFVDNDISASTLSNKPRPAYAEMLNRVRAGEFTHVLAYSNSRITRRPLELEDLIVLHGQTNVLIKTVVSGDDDLSTADGRMVARIKASVDAAEAERTSERVTRAMRQRAEQGKQKKGRWRTYGYDDDFHIIESEAVVIRDAFKRVIAGESLQAIADHWRSTGVTMQNGKTVYHSTVRNIVKRPLYAGLQAYKGEIIGDAAVDAIIDRATFDAAQIVLNDASKPRGKNARTYLLTGLMTCGNCLYPMSGNPGNVMADGNRTWTYTCKKAYGGCAKVNVSGPKVEAIVFTIIRQSLIARKQRKAPVLVDYSGPIQIEQDAIKAVQDAVSAGELTTPDALPLMKVHRAKISELQTLAAKQVIDDETSGGFVDWRGFTQGSLSDQRAQIGEVFSAIVIKPSSKGRLWDADRVELHFPNGQIRTGNDVWDRAVKQGLVRSDMERRFTGV